MHLGVQWWVVTHRTAATGNRAQALHNGCQRLRVCGVGTLANILHSNIQLLNKPRVFLDILEAQLWFFAHQPLDQIPRLARFVLINRDADQFP